MHETDGEILLRERLLEILKISDRTERRLRRSGKPWIPHLRIGNKVYYRVAAIEQFLLAQEQAHSGQGPAGDDYLANAGADVDTDSLSADLQGQTIPLTGVTPSHPGGAAQESGCLHQPESDHV